jgi:hypothetical protein
MLSTAPDWTLQKAEVLCPLCEYNLRGLTEPRCPECGFSFQWSELLDPNRRLHPYLFEHHPERNVWSFWKTLAGGPRPAHFWRSLHPAQPSRPGRIAIYAILTMLPLLLVCAIHIGLGTAAESAWQYGVLIGVRTGRWNGAVSGRAPISMTLLILNLQSWTRYDPFGRFILVCLLWPWLTLLALNVFRWSMRRAHIRQVHVLRCVVYSADLLLIIWPFLGICTALFWIDLFGSWSLRSPNAVFQIRASFLEGIRQCVGILLLAIFVYRLIQAYRCYLRFDHVLATVVCSQVISFLIAWKLVFLMQGL